MTWTVSISPALFPAGLMRQVSLLHLQLLRTMAPPTHGNSLWTTYACPLSQVPAPQVPSPMAASGALKERAHVEPLWLFLWLVTLPQQEAAGHDIHHGLSACLGCVSWAL